MPSTVEFHRVLRCPPERVFRAFTTAGAMVKWLPPHGYTGQVFEMDAVVGGRWRMAFMHLASGMSHAFGGVYLELLPGERLRYTSAFDDPGLPGEMSTTVTLTPVYCGTSLHVVQEGIPDVIPPAACHLGWQESLALLALLVEAEPPAE
jgi:uncharacterized protein YndB with AHSA1/START domain